MRGRIDNEHYEVMRRCDGMLLLLMPRGGDADGGRYQDWDSFEKDIVLIFNNAMTYNQKVMCCMKNGREVFDL